MTEAARLRPETFAADGSIVSTVATPLRREQIGVADDAPTRARQLDQIQAHAAEASEAARSNRWNQARYFEDIAVTAGGNFSVTHGLGRKVYADIVRWAPTVAGTGIDSPPPTVSETDNSSTFRASAAGVLTLAVW